MKIFHPTSVEKSSVISPNEVRFPQFFENYDCEIISFSKMYTLFVCFAIFNKSDTSEKL